MANFYLYLDESGTFDIGKGAPSIVAGFLAEKKCTETQARELLTRTKKSSPEFATIEIEHFHAMKHFTPELCEFITALLEKMSLKNFRLVVFKNAKNFVSVNSDVTYLNVFAEGIVNLMQHLLARTTDEIILHVHYASRMNVKERDLYGITLRIDEKSYLERIEERIDFRMLRLKDSERKRIKKILYVDRADRSQPLMLADAVCFALRGGRKNFTSEQKSRIKTLPTVTFNLLQKLSWREIQNLLIENRLSEAIYSWYGRGTPTLFEEYSEQFRELVVSKFKALSHSARKLQYDATAQLIGMLVDARDFDAAKKFIRALDEEFFPLLRENDLPAQEFFFDVHFYRLTVATHEGNTLEEQREIATCRKLLPTLPATCETLDYFLKYKLREVEYLKNVYDFEQAIEKLNRLEKILSSTVELLSLIDDLGDFGRAIRSTTLGKVNGSRAATKIYLSVTKPEILASARDDLTRAVEQFSASSDKARQFQLRSMLETVAGNFQESLTWLGKAFGVEENPSPEKVLSAIKNFAGFKAFGLLHYSNLMAAAMTANHPLGRELFDVWTSLNAEEFLKDSFYPVPVILCRAGKCRALLGHKTAKKFYDDAANSLIASSMNFTLFAECLLVEADQFATLGGDTKLLRKIQADYQKFSQQQLPESLRAVFADWENLSAVPTKNLRDFFAAQVKKIPVI